MLLFLFFIMYQNYSALVKLCPKFAKLIDYATHTFSWHNLTFSWHNLTFSWHNLTFSWHNLTFSWHNLTFSWHNLTFSWHNLTFSWHNLTFSWHNLTFSLWQKMIVFCGDSIPPGGLQVVPAPCVVVVGGGLASTLWLHWWST